MSCSLAYDSSPQHGVEMFNTSLRAVSYLPSPLPAINRETPFADHSWASGCWGRQTLLPCQVLGCGRMSVPDKLATLLHQFVLEFGPGEDAIRRALSCVVCALSDMGADIAIAEARDCLPEFMAKGVVPTVCTGGVSDHQDFLFQTRCRCLDQSTSWTWYCELRFLQCAPQGWG